MQIGCEKPNQESIRFYGLGGPNFWPFLGDHDDSFVSKSVLRSTEFRYLIIQMLIASSRGHNKFILAFAGPAGPTRWHDETSKVQQGPGKRGKDKILLPVFCSLTVRSAIELHASLQLI